jgi:ubiquitin carboxyl-terminal hydrolase 9/24
VSSNVFFPISDLQRLDEMLNRTRWVVPVLPKNELETLLDASIALCRQGNDTKSEHCQRFFRDGLMISFIKILTDDAVNTWKYDIYVTGKFNLFLVLFICILNICLIYIETYLQ